MLNIAPEDRICAQKLNNYPPASVVQDTSHSWPSALHDAPGCVNTLELDL